MSHPIVEIRDALPAMLVVLVRLDCDAGERGITLDVIRLPQEPMSWTEAAPKQLFNIDLAAGGCEGEEIKVVDMDVPVQMGLRMDRIEHKHVIELFCAFRAVFQHGAHCSIAVNVGVLPFNIVFPCGLIGQFLIGFHQAGVHIADAGALRPVEDIFLRGAGMAGLDQLVFNRILHLFDRRRVTVRVRLFHMHCHQLRKLPGGLPVVAAERLRRLEDRVGDFINVKQHAPSVALDNGVDHHSTPCSNYYIYVLKKYTLLNIVISKCCRNLF